MTGIVYLESDFRARVRGWLRELEGLGVSYIVTSTKRSRAEQQALYEAYLRGERSLPAAPPGTSLHESGRAIDVVFQETGGPLVFGNIESIARDYGIHRPLPTKDPVHWEPLSGRLQLVAGYEDVYTPAKVTESIQLGASVQAPWWSFLFDLPKKF